MPYGRFLAANTSGGILWATGITCLIWFLGLAAEQWLSRMSWLGLAAAVAVGLAITLLIRRKARALTQQTEARAKAEAEAADKRGDAKAPAARPGPPGR
jgi:membrane protein DedA with SNARE-associated domain